MLDVKALMDYEVRASWWASRVKSQWMQSLAARYFAFKVKRKYARYCVSLAVAEELRKLSKVSV